MAIPARIGNYRVVREIGRGGMGIVYEAVHEGLERRVALKILPSFAAANQKALERFQREASAAARLTHPGIVNVYEAGEADGMHFIAMECVDGESLADRHERIFRERARNSGQDATTVVLEFESQQAGGATVTIPPRPSRVNLWGDDFRGLVRVVSQAARALDAAHAEGVLHRDVKPGNILVDGDGEAKLVDFGLARIRQDRTLTLTGEVMGTPSYMSPEQLSGGKHATDARTDVYGLGVTLYECVTQRVPFEADSVQSLMHEITSREPTDPRRFNSGVPKDLATIILKAIDREPGRRYATAGDMAEDLDRFLAGAPVHARPLGLITRMARFVRRRRVPVAAAILILGALGLALSVFLELEQARSRQRQDEARSLVTQGLTASVLGAGSKAIATYSKALEHYSDSVEALVFRGMERFVGNRPELAEADFERGLAIDAGYAPLRVAYGMFLGRTGREAEAARVLDEVDVSTVSDTLDLDALGCVYHIMGDELEALQYFRRARLQDRARISSLLGEAWSLFFLGRFKESEDIQQALRKVVQDSKLSTLVLVYIRFNQIRFAKGEYRRRLVEDARKLVEELGQEVGKDAMATVCCAAVDSLQSGSGDEIHEPLDCLRKAVALYAGGNTRLTEIPSSLFFEIVALIAMDLDQDLARQYAQRALAGSSRGLARYVLGVLAARAGDAAQARRHLEASLERAPQQPQVLAALMDLRDSGEPVLPLERRTALAHRMVRILPDDPELLTSAGRVLEEAAALRAAGVSYRHALERFRSMGSAARVSATEAVLRRLDKASR